MILVVDNYDSFTFNLVQGLAPLGVEIAVKRNNAVDIDWVEHSRPAAIVLSPGPGRPEDAGVSSALVTRFSGQIPILGVCLGHQCIATCLGGRVVRASRPMHGKTSWVHHDARTLFAGIEDPFEAMRYHSLIVEKASLPSCVEVSAWTEGGEIMGIRHRHLAIEGVQFHPESFLTPVGNELLRNFVDLYVHGHPSTLH